MAAAVLLEPGLVPSGAVEVAGDERTLEEVAQALGRRAGAQARFEPDPVESIRDDDTRAMFEWLASPPAYQADLEVTRRLEPAVQDLDGFLTSTPGAGRLR